MRKIVAAVFVVAAMLPIAAAPVSAFSCVHTFRVYEFSGASGTEYRTFCSDDWPNTGGNPPAGANFVNYIYPSGASVDNSVRSIRWMNTPASYRVMFYYGSSYGGTKYVTYHGLEAWENVPYPQSANLSSFAACGGPSPSSCSDEP